MSTFDQLLGKLAELLVGGERAPSNAMAGARDVAQSLDPQVTYRASMLPVGNYDDGSVGMVWPQSAVDAKNAFARFHRGEAPQPQDAVLAGLAMTGAGAYGLGRSAVSRGSVAGAERAEASSGLPSQSVEAGRFDFTPGTPRSADIGRSSISYLPEDGMVELTALGTPEAYRGQGSATQALQQFTGALDEAGLPSRLVARGDAGTDPARLQQFYAAHGYEPPGADGYMVRQAKTLFSNPPGAAPTGLLATGEGEHHSRAQPRSPSGQFVTSDSFDGRLVAFEKVLVDLDGDGTPDAMIDASQPSNAMRVAKEDYYGTEPSMGPFDFMNPIPSFPSMTYTQDMAIPPDQYINDQRLGYPPVTGPNYNLPSEPNFGRRQRIFNGR
jgi:GNAT superfamily N-acetyltransferase